MLERFGIRVTVGVARTKFLAKVASGVAKPDGLLVVPIDGEIAFLHGLPVERLWGVGPVTSRKLRERSITTVAQVAELGEPALVRVAGTGGRTAPPRPRAQSRSAPRGGRSPPSLDGHPTGTRAAAPLARAAQCRSARPDRSAGAAIAEGTPRVPNGDVAPPLRRLLTGDQVAHSARGDGGHSDVAGGRPDSTCSSTRCPRSSSGASR